MEIIVEATPIDITRLRPGDRLRTVEGNLVEVTEPSRDGEWIQLRYVGGNRPGLAGTSDPCAAEDLELVQVAGD